MIVVLFSAGRRAQPSRTVQAIAALSAAVAPGGDEFVLVSWHPPRTELAAAVGEVVVLGPAGTPPQSATGQASLPAKIVGRLRDPGRMWRAARRDERVGRATGAAGMLVALDTPATLTAWRFAGRNERAEAVLGFDAAGALLVDGRDVSGVSAQVR
ncbi:MAG: hypothetical protein ACHQE5_04240 [Actinomycetes bacterium]